MSLQDSLICNPFFCFVLLLLLYDTCPVQALMDLNSYDINPRLQQQLRVVGVDKFFPVQAQCFDKVKHRSRGRAERGGGGVMMIDACIMPEVPDS